jgi:5-methylcytosine-specific restriction endonuclease McrA
MDTKVLVLNQDYSALTLCTINKAFLLLFLNKAEIVANVENVFLRTVSRAFPKPSVIRLQRYAHVPYKGVTLNRQNVMRRDNFQCQYCGTGKQLTIDHLTPRSKGGKSNWKNLVTACSRCNAMKGDQSPEQAGLKLRAQPYKPSFTTFLKGSPDTIQDSWKTYLIRDN